MHRSLERADTIIGLRNQEISALNSRLRARDEVIAEAIAQIDKPESELSNRELIQSDNLEKLAPARADFSKVEAADLLNQLKARRKKSRADLADIEAVLSILAELGT